MRNSARRSRNIGTLKQGHGNNNTLTISTPCHTFKAFYERLGKYDKLEKLINGHRFIFVIEQTRAYSAHACSVVDVAHLIEQVSVADYGELRLIVFRQPKRKEELLSPVWGRLLYSYEFEGSYYPAIVLEAVDYRRKLHWPTGLTVAAQQELARLRSDGHDIKQKGRFFVADYQLENVRNTQLYRTLLHEFGHYVHYLEVVGRPAVAQEQVAQREARQEKYASIPHLEKEAFAHRYADKLRQKLVAAAVIPIPASDKK